MLCTDLIGRGGPRIGHHHPSCSPGHCPDIGNNPYPTPKFRKGCGENVMLCLRAASRHCLIGCVRFSKSESSVEATNSEDE